MRPHVSLITLGISDLDRSIRFYGDGLGWKRSSIGVETNEVAFFHTNGSILVVWLREELAKDAGVSPEGSGFSGFALAHNVPTHDEVDQVLALAGK